MSKPTGGNVSNVAQSKPGGLSPFKAAKEATPVSVQKAAQIKPMPALILTPGSNQNVPQVAVSRKAPHVVPRSSIVVKPRTSTTTKPKTETLSPGPSSQPRASSAVIPQPSKAGVASAAAGQTKPATSQPAPVSSKQVSAASILSTLFGGGGQKKVTEPSPLSPVQTPGRDVITPLPSAVPSAVKNVVKKQPNNNSQVNFSKGGKQQQGRDKELVKQMESYLTEKEIRRLGTRFRKLDADSSGSISMAEFRSIPELHNNPLVDRVVEIFDVDRNGEVDFREFIHGMSQFTYSDNPETRLRLAFRIFDVDNDGFISPGELFQVLQLMCGTNLTDIQLQQLIDHTFLMCDKDKDGKISFDEFCSATKNCDAHKRMTIDKVFF